MKNTLFCIIFLSFVFSATAQQNLGVRNSNYSGIQGSLLNPSSIADSKLKFDVNILSGDVVFANDFLYAPKASLHLLGFKRIIQGSIHEDLFFTHFNPGRPNQVYNVTLSTEILGPSFFVKIMKKHVVGLTMAARAYGNINHISGNLAQNSYNYFLEKDLWNTNFQNNSPKVNSMGWLQFGLHYATVVYSKGKDQLTAGLSVNYLQGIAAAYVKNAQINYKISDTSNLNFTNTSLDYGRTDIGDYKKLHGTGELNHGHGFGADIGFTYVHLRYPAGYSAAAAGIGKSGRGQDNYLYKIGLSFIDMGSINFNKNAATYHLQSADANFSNWHQSQFSGNVQLDRTLSAVFYQGDSAKSRTGDHFSMALPAAISLQADWNVCQHVYVNATIIKGLGHGNHQGVTRPDVYSLAPRYETKWGEVSLPVSLLYYGHLQPRLGLSLRAGYFFIGGDAPGSLLKLNNLEGVDFYAGVHFFIAEKK